jgi:hypothetical protein
MMNRTTTIQTTMAIAMPAAGKAGYLPVATTCATVSATASTATGWRCARAIRRANRRRMRPANGDGLHTEVTTRRKAWRVSTGCRTKANKKEFILATDLPSDLQAKLRAQAEAINCHSPNCGCELCEDIVAFGTEQYRAGASAERARQQGLIQTWQPIATAPKDGTVILRPHRIWGAMDVRYITDSDAQRVSVLADGIPWRWLNGDYTTAWTDEAFMPFWMPLPSSPFDDPLPCADELETGQ